MTEEVTKTRAGTRPWISRSPSPIHRSSHRVRPPHELRFPGDSAGSSQSVPASAVSFPSSVLRLPAKLSKLPGRANQGLGRFRVTALHRSSTAFLNPLQPESDRGRKSFPKLAFEAADRRVVPDSGQPDAVPPVPDDALRVADAEHSLFELGGCQSVLSLAERALIPFAHRRLLVPTQLLKVLGDDFHG
jgi:hypothetical protein